MKQKVIIIYNPISGAKRGIDLPKLVEQYLDKTKFEYVLYASKSAEDMTRLSKEAAVSDADIVVAAGGDGSANTVSKQLINTNKKFYLFPLGSGNGFARHFHIPMQIIQAIRSLANCNFTTTVSTGMMNDIHFINVAGTGFDAHISQIFAHTNKRGFWGYFKAVLKELPYQSKTYKISNGNITWQGKAFLISVANATQWGNDVKIAPHADPTDEILDLVMIKRFSLIAAPCILIRLLIGKIKKSKYFYLLSGKELIIEREHAGVAHVDGDPVNTDNKLVFKCTGKLHVLHGS
ncbi:MAG: YegS/Rv2252/BmrU family lipid kinase [Bacteroidia bacterium]|nr:YegS/Rv2252/BmrU family lipid kinase [Bacteroidia bacterium]